MLNSCARNPVTGKKEVVFMSENQEVAMGKQADPSITANFGLYEDSKIQSFISQKGKLMAKVSHRPKLKYEFKVLDSHVVNAFALPGGYVYFTRGILAHFNNEAEFAGVLGHEIGHVTARHSVKQQRNQMLGQLGFIVGVIASKEFREFAEIAYQGMGLMFLKFSRDHESQSDELGVEYSTKIGYDAHYMGDFFKTLNRLSTKDGGQRIPTFQSTHPDPLDRYRKVHEMADTWQAKTKKGKNVKRDKYLRMIDGLVYGEDPRQGFVEYDKFYHPELKFQFPVPRLWKHQNSPIQFQMAPENGKSLLIFTLGKGKTLKEAAQNATKDYKLQSRGTKPKKVNGLDALIMESNMIQQQQQQQGGKQQPKIKLLSYFIKYNNLIYAFHGMAAEADFAKYKDNFISSAEGFKSLSDPNKLNRKPERIRIKTVAKTATLSTIFKDMKISPKKAKTLAILNGMELNEIVKKGMLIKTIGK